MEQDLSKNQLIGKLLVDYDPLSTLLFNLGNQYFFVLC